MRLGKSKGKYCSTSKYSRLKRKTKCDEPLHFSLICKDIYSCHPAQRADCFFKLKHLLYLLFVTWEQKQLKYNSLFKLRILLLLFNDFVFWVFSFGAQNGSLGKQGLSGQPLAAGDKQSMFSLCLEIFFGVLFHVTLSILLAIKITTDLLNASKIFCDKKPFQLNVLRNTSLYSLTVLACKVKIGDIIVDLKKND